MYNVHTLVYLQADPPSTHKSIKLVNVPTNDGIKHAQMAEMDRNGIYKTSRHQPYLITDHLPRQLRPLGAPNTALRQAWVRSPWDSEGKIQKDVDVTKKYQQKPTYTRI